MATVGNLEVYLGIDKQSFDDGIRDAAARLDEMDGAVAKAGRSIQAFGSKLQGIGKGLAVGVTAPLAAAGTAALAFATRFADAAGQTADVANRIGVATDALQELRFAAEATGADAATVDTSLRRLARRMGDAAAGTGSLKKVFDQYGIAVRDADGNMRSTEAVFRDLSDAIAGAESQQERLRIAFAAFDVEGAKLVPLMQEGGAGLDSYAEKARALGVVLDAQTIAAGERFGDEMLELQKALTGAGTAIGAALLPAINELIPVFREHAIPAIQGMAEGVATAIRWFSELPAPVQEAAGIIATALGAAGPAVLAIGTFAKVLGGLVVAAGPIGLFIAAATTAFVVWQTWGDDIKALVSGVAEWLGTTFTALSEAVVGIWTGMGEMIYEAIAAPFTRIREMVSGIGSFFVETWQGVSDVLVGNSIIPDMMTMMEEQFGRLHGMAETNRAVAGDVARAWSDSAADQRDAIQRGTTEALGLLGQFFEGSKAIGIAQAIANTWIGVSETLARYPWPIAGVLAAAHAAAGLANVASLRSVGKTSKGGGGAASGGSRTAGSTATAATVQRQVVTLEGISPASFYSGEQIVALINDAQRRGARIEIAR